MPSKLNPEKRGLGWDHRRHRQRLLARHRDGAPCPCLDDPADPCGPGCICRPSGHGLPMYRAPERNPDRMALEADHTLARSQGGTRADRLMLATCNRSRGDGTRGQAGAPTTAPTWWTRRWYDLPTAGQPGRIVVLLCGPPGAGKTTAARDSGLTVYDRDDQHWQDEAHFRQALAALAADPTARAVVIRTAASSTARAKAAQLCAATHTYLLTAPVRQLEQRVARRDRDDKTVTLAAIRTWHERHDRDDHVPDFPGWGHVPGMEDHHALAPATSPA